MLTNVYKYDKINWLVGISHNITSDFYVPLLKQLHWQLHEYFPAKIFIFH